MNAILTCYCYSYIFEFRPFTQYINIADCRK